MIISGTPVGPTFKATAPNAVWSPSSQKKNILKLNCDLQIRRDTYEEKSQEQTKEQSSAKQSDDDQPSPVWQPFGAPYSPQFRPVKLEVKTTATRTTTAVRETEQPKKHENETTEDKESKPKEKSERAESLPPSQEVTKESIQKSPSESAVNTSASTTFVKSGWSSHLPPSQSPTITLLQKARGQIPKGAIYIDERSDSNPIPKNAVLIDQKVTVEGDKVHTDSYYAVPTLSTETSTHTIKAPPKYDGIGPTEYGIPVGLRTGVKEEYASDWYKTMYKSLHRARFPNEPNQAVHFGGYMSEPEFDRKDTYRAKYLTEHRRKPEKTVSYTVETSTGEKLKSERDSSVVRHEQRKYKVEPRSIAEYEPGHSSLAEKEFNKFWSDFWNSMDDLHEHLDNISPRPQQGLNRRWANVLLSDGYESDSTLIRKTGRVPHVDPEQQKAWYKEIQKGGEIPFIGLRKSAPEKPTETQPKFYPAAHVYGVEPPCFNHKHIPNSSSKLTSAYVFRANPVLKNSSFLIQNSSMSTRRPPPPAPPIRCSSKRKHILKSADLNSQSHSDYGYEFNLYPEKSRKFLNDKSSDLYQFNVTENINGPNGFQHCKQFISNSDLPKCVHEDFSYIDGSRTGSPFKASNSNTKLVDRNFGSYDCLNSSIVSMPVNRENIYSYKSSFNSELDESKKFHNSSSYFPDVPSYSHPLTKSHESYVQCANHQTTNIGRCSYSCPLHQQIECFNSTSISSEKSSHLCANNANEKEIYVTEKDENNYMDETCNKEWKPETFKSFKQTGEFSEHVQGSDTVKLNRNEHLTDMYSGKLTSSDSSIQGEYRLPKLYPQDNSFEQILNSSSSSFAGGQNNLSHILKFSNEKENIQSNNCLSVIQSNSSTNASDCLRNAIEDSVPSENSYNFKHCYDSDHFIKSICYPERKDFDIKNNLKNFEVNCKRSLNKIQTRMITILPSVVHVSKLTVENLEPKLVHSEPQIIRKQFCKLDLNPLRLYLKRYGQNISQNFDECHLKKINPDTGLNGSRKVSYIAKNKVDICLNGFILKKQKYFCNEPGNILTRLENLPSCKKNFVLKSNKVICDLPLPSADISHTSLGSSVNIQSHICKPSNSTIQTTFTRHMKNIFMDKSNVVLYHQYISTMVHSIAKSKKFLLLKNFYAGLEHINNLSVGQSSEFTTIKIKQFDVSWGKLSNYKKWDKEQDPSLKIRQSSVEDLRQLFQIKDPNEKKIKAPNHSSFEYRKLWYNVSVSNLIQKYSSMQNIQESIEVRFDSEMYQGNTTNNELLKLSLNDISCMSERAVPFPFQRFSINSFPERHINAYSKLKEAVKTPRTSFTASVSSSSSDIHLPRSSHIQRKVKFFEDVSQNKNWKKTYPAHCCSSDDLKIGKFSQSRNLSWSDLRNLDKCFSRGNNSVFSPRYLPEKAMSCLDLSIVSECSQTTVDPSFMNFDRGWTSSSNSCFSQDDAEKRNCARIRSIKTGTVSKIKRKLEQATLSRSKSVPQNITRSEDKLFGFNGLPLMTANVSPGSVQNLKQFFEPEDRDITFPNSYKTLSSTTNSLKIKKRETSYLCQSERDLKGLSKENSNCESSWNTCSKDLSLESDGHKSALEHYMKERFHNLITRFEKSSSADITKNEPSIPKQSFCYEPKVIRHFPQNSFNENLITTTAVTELSLSFNGINSTTVSRTANVHSQSFYHHNHIDGTPKNVVKNTKEWNSENWRKSYFPKVQNNFPKPYVKRENNYVCSPMKICHPGLYEWASY